MTRRTPTVYGLSNRKNDLVLAKLRTGGVQVYEGRSRYVRAVRDAGPATAVVSSSANTEQVLGPPGSPTCSTCGSTASIAKRASTCAGKPAPGHVPGRGAPTSVSTRQQAAVFEDALAGVEAGRAGGFGFVVGVDRVGQADALREHGADIVVTDLAELLEHDSERR